MEVSKKRPRTKENVIHRILIVLIETYISLIMCAMSVILLPILFIYLNNVQQHYFIDEKFHVPQTLQYCNGNLYDWDPKITTLPGLYLFAALILGPLKLCTIMSLRFINLICTFINFVLFYKILKKLRPEKKTESKFLDDFNLFLSTWNIAFFPPLFFWFFLYYTDVFSVTLILLMYLSHLHQRDKTAAFVGALAVCARQTNVIWVAFIGIERGLDVMEQLTRQTQNPLNPIVQVKYLYIVFRAKAKKGITSFLQFIKSVCKPFIFHLLVLLSFVIFVLYNGGIVIGDKSAHKPTVHVTQILYFSAFILLFSWPYFIPYFCKFLNQFKYIFVSFIVVGVIIHNNTMVHPYILADNRHYSFYIWKNFMNRYHFFKYLMIPVYSFSIYCIYMSIVHKRLLSIINLSFCICLVLIPQLLLEPRYFIIPYILYKLQLRQPQKWQLIAETLTTVLINIFQFTLFVNKTFNWIDEEHPQRIAW